MINIENELNLQEQNYIKGEKKAMTNEQIKQIADDIKAYEEAIENAEGALAEAEREMNEALADTCLD